MRGNTYGQRSHILYMYNVCKHSTYPLILWFSSLAETQNWLTGPVLAFFLPSLPPSFPFSLFVSTKPLPCSMYSSFTEFLRFPNLACYFINFFHLLSCFLWSSFIPPFVLCLLRPTTVSPFEHKRKTLMMGPYIQHLH